MTEPEIIHSEKAHEISIPEGSHMAISKTATPQEPSVRKTYRAGGGEADSESEADRMATQDQGFVSDRLAHADTGIAPDHMASDHPVEADDRFESPPVTTVAPDPIAIPPSNSAPSQPGAGHDQGADPSPQVSVTADDTSNTSLASDTVSMPAMDFPARVVHLHIENDKIRSRLDQLEGKSDH